mmetsp:Transcript_19288/g.20903  ORF Transcript_19288/g.20903 Transcript_19288/m.20903 type:complete len:1541 (+) Transcript_19288:262-4884(+)
MQSKRSNNNISFRRLSSGGSISSTTSEYFNRRTSKNEFERMYIQWTQACESEGYMLPKNAIAEFKKRISQAGKLGDKAKLNLSYCSLDDKRLISLVECLAQKPVIAKLDLRGNDFTDEGVKMIVKILKGQLRLVKEIEKDKRLTVAFLGEVDLEHNSKELDHKLTRKISHMCDALKIVNAHAFIRSKYLESHAPDVILSPFLIKMWFDVVGKLDHDRISKAFANANISERSTLGYEELEKILTQGLLLRGALPNLNEETWKTIKSEKSMRYKANGNQDDDEDWLVRELNSIPVHSRSQGELLVGKDDSSSVTEVEATSATELQRKDSQESILTNEDFGDDVHTYNDQVDALNSPTGTRTSIPFMASVPTYLSPPVYLLANSSVQFNVPESATEETEVPSSELVNESSISHAIDDSDVHADQPSDLAEGHTVLSHDILLSPTATEITNVDESEQRHIQDTPEQILRIPSDYSIPRIDTVSRLTTFDAEENYDNSNGVRRDDSQRKLSDLFTEIDEVFVNGSQQRHVDNIEIQAAHEVQNEEVDEEEKLRVAAAAAAMKSNTPKPPINTPSKYINLPRKGSNLYEDTVLELPNRNLAIVRFSEYLSPNRFRMLKVLILRNNRISTLNSLQLFQLLPNVTDLDLAYNELQHRILDIDLPRRIQRLDLSYNQLTDISGIMSCAELRELNVSHNQIKALYGLPVKLVRLDISYNRIHTVASLRSLSICVSLSSITVKNNPVVITLPNVKVFLRSVMPNLQEIDGVKVGLGIMLDKKKSLESMKPTPVSPKPTIEEQKMQDSLRASQVLAKQKLVAASKSVIDEFINESNKSKRLNPDEVSSLTKRLYAPRGSPNDPRKYVTKVIAPPKKTRRHSGDGKTAAPDSIAIVDEWLGHASQQFDRIVKAFRIAKSFIRLERVKEKELETFNNIFDDIMQHRLNDVNIQLKACLDTKYKDHDKINDVPKIQHDIEKSILILQQIQTIILFCVDGAIINFVDGMDLIMGSKAGQYVNDSVLKLYNCHYEVNYNYQDFVTRQASTRSISNEGFNYDVRDEFISDNPMVPDSRRRSSMITILSQSHESAASTQSGNNLQNSSGINPLERVRNRVMNKYLPPDVRLDMSLDENSDTVFAEANPMKLARSPFRNSVMTEEIVNQVMHDVSQSEVKELNKEEIKTSFEPVGPARLVAPLQIRSPLLLARPTRSNTSSASSTPAAASIPVEKEKEEKKNREAEVDMKHQSESKVVESFESPKSKIQEKVKKPELTIEVPEEPIPAETAIEPISLPAPVVPLPEVSTVPATVVTEVSVSKDTPIKVENSPASTPVKSSKVAASPLLRPTSFKSSIEKITRKISSKDVSKISEQSKVQEEKKEEPLSAKERLRRRMTSNKTKPETPNTSSFNISTEGTEKGTTDNVELETNTGILINETDDNKTQSTPVKKSNSIDSVDKSPVQVQTTVITVSSPKLNNGSISPRSKSPSLSPKQSSSNNNSRASTPTTTPKSNNTSTEFSVSPKASKVTVIAAAEAVDVSKLNAKERLRLRMEKNKTK